MRLILGGPGTGKTTELLRVVEDELASGVDPKHIAFVAFTRKAAHEARSRAAERFGFTDDDMPYFRTLHSLAFKQLALEPAEVMADADYRELGQALGLTFGHTDDDIGIAVGDDKGSQLAYLDQIARLTLKPLDVTCRERALQPYWEARLYCDALAEYKKTRHKQDFTDMLTLFTDRAVCPYFKVVIVDEAQDLSPLQWRMVERITRAAERVYIAGDDDQAIYEWAGADVHKFLTLKGERYVLPVSYRLPQVVFDKAQDIVRRISQRYEKQWAPAGPGGAVHYYGEPEQVDLREGSWLLLARNRYMLTDYTAMLQEQGYPYTLHGKSSTDSDVVRALVYWERLRRGDALTLEQVRMLYVKVQPQWLKQGARTMTGASEDTAYTLNDLRTKWGLRAEAAHDWMAVLQMAQAKREYLRAVLRRKESLLKPPRITVSTVHQVKGGEADHVLLRTDMAYSCYREWIRNPDSESRVFYVAATRAKQALHVLYARSNKFYEV